MINKKYKNERTDQAISHYREYYDESKRLTDGFVQLNEDKTMVKSRLWSYSIYLSAYSQHCSSYGGCYSTTWS
jgi:hypothetical protein